MQKLLLQTSAPGLLALTELSLHQGSADPRSNPNSSIGCIRLLTNLQTLSIDGFRYTPIERRAVRSLRALTALRLHGYIHHQLYQSELECAASCCFRSLLSLDLEFVVPHSRHCPPSETAMRDLRRDVLERFQPVVCALPLHLGARITVTTLEHCQY